MLYRDGDGVEKDSQKVFGCCGSRPKRKVPWAYAIWRLCTRRDWECNKTAAKPRECFARLVSFVTGRVVRARTVLVAVGS
jgi:hypothetical protein